MVPASPRRRILVMGGLAVVAVLVVTSGVFVGAAFHSSGSVPPSGLRASASDPLSWSLLADAHGPPARYGASEVWDPSINAVLLFGGGTIPFNGGVYVDNDTWIFQNGTWTNLTPVLSVSPPARVLAGMVCDPVDNYVVLFGGLSGGAGTPANNLPFNDTWVFENRSWHQLSTPVAASSPDNPAMTWDAADGYVLLFGGEISYRAVYANDTWMFRGGAWSRIATVPGPGVLPRSEAAMSYEPMDGYVVMFGGWNGVARLGDTWMYSAGRWSKLPPSVAPAPRVNGNSGMAFDPLLNESILFGGENLTTFYGDTWGFASGIWTQLVSNASVSPPARQGGALVYDPAENGVLLFGGEPTWPATLNDTWLLSATPIGSNDPPTSSMPSGVPILPIISGNSAMLVFLGVGIGTAVTAGVIAVRYAVVRSARRP